MSAREILKTYKAPYGVKKNFSFLKESLITNDTFLKKPSRIGGLVFILLVGPMMSQLSGTIILKHGNQRFLTRNSLRAQGLNYLKALGFDETIYTIPPPPSRTHRPP